MTPDFSASMLKGFLRARVKMTAYMAAYPNPPLEITNLKRAEAAAMSSIRQQAKVTSSEFQLAWNGYAIPVKARLRLWKALGANPAAHKIRLVGWDEQEVLSDAA